MFAFFGLGIGELVILGMIAVGGAVVLIVVLKAGKGSAGAGDEVRHLRVEVDRLREENERLREEAKHAISPGERQGGADTGIKQT
jgi:hypothetical protein